MYGLALAVYLILLTVSCCIAVVGTYLLLNGENYRWQVRRGAARRVKRRERAGQRRGSRRQCSTGAARTPPHQPLHAAAALPACPQWTSFGMAASTSLYVFIYAAVLFFTRTSMTGLLQTSFYFGWVPALPLPLLPGAATGSCPVS